MKKIAINGLGRIGRLFFRQIIEQEGVEVVAINDLAPADNLAYLLKYDSTYGRLAETVSESGGELTVGNRKIKILQEKDPTKLPWGELGVDLVVEATGAFTSYEKAKVHLEAGAKRVVISAPSKDVDGTENGKTILVGVNDEDLSETNLTCNGSCTTNAVAVVVKILDEQIGVEKAMLNTIHGYTSSQGIVDGPAKPGAWQRGRAGAQNIVLSTTGAATTVGKVLPEMVEKFDGMATRVPVIAGSIADVTFIAKKDVTEQEINNILTEASKNPIYKGMLKVETDPIVSSDVIGQPFAAIVDLSYTKVVGGNLVKVLSWYDNEWGYAFTLVKHVMQALK